MLAWLALVGVALWARPLMPVDETRYLSVAWEMWLRGDWLVPHLNGQPYHHKPPLLFWLIQAGWRIGGVSETWGRLVAPLFGLANLALTVALGRRLWPERPAVAEAAPWFLLGGFWWATYTTLTMFDMLVVSFTLIGLLGIVVAWRGRSAVGWALFALGIAGGVLSKGPVIAVFLLPPALLAPLWMAKDRPGWIGWYGGVLTGLAAGVALALAWALPAARAGGVEYGNAILWGQTSGRMVKSFAHRREIWFYLAALPAMLLPWTLWPPLWRGAITAWRERRQLGPSTGARFCALAVVPALLFMSAVSGKQPQYLLPLLPLLALGLAAVLSHAVTVRNIDPWPVALTAGLVGLTLIGAIGLVRWEPDLAARLRAPEWLDDLPILLGVAVSAAAILAGLVARALPKHRLAALALLSAGTVMILHVGARPTVRPYFDLASLSTELRKLEQEGRPLAKDDEYHGQFNFLGRLTRPIAVVPRTGLATWAMANPNGAIVLVERGPVEGPAPLYRQSYRGRALAIREAKDLVKP